jgi:acyl carrier protein phosphodiesterase
LNFLGHIFLTPEDDEILLGNFIADSVKGNPDKLYSGRIADGIRFHRAIDAFTDSHEVVKKGVERFRSTQGRYAPVVIDVIYDHVLASQWEQFHNEALEQFSQSVYARLAAHQTRCPSRVQHYFPYMRSQNWLFNYQFQWGIKKSLEGLDTRSVNHTQMHLALDVYSEFEVEFKSEFKLFIIEAQLMAHNYFLPGNAERDTKLTPLK